MDLFKVNKKNFITTTCQLFGLKVGEPMNNTSAEEAVCVLESLFLKVLPPSKIVEAFVNLMTKYGIVHDNVLLIIIRLMVHLKSLWTP